MKRRAPKRFRLTALYCAKRSIPDYREEKYLPTLRLPRNKVITSNALMRRCCNSGATAKNKSIERLPNLLRANKLYCRKPNRLPSCSKEIQTTSRVQMAIIIDGMRRLGTCRSNIWNSSGKIEDEDAVIEIISSDREFSMCTRFWLKWQIERLLTLEIEDDDLTITGRDFQSGTCRKPANN